MSGHICEDVAPYMVKYFEMWRSADKHLQDTFGEDYDKLIGCLSIEVGIDGDTPHDWHRVGIVKHEDSDCPVLILD